MPCASCAWDVSCHERPAYGSLRFRSSYLCHARGTESIQGSRFKIMTKNICGNRPGLAVSPFRGSDKVFLPLPRVPILRSVSCGCSPRAKTCQASGLDSIIRNSTPDATETIAALPVATMRGPPARRIGIIAPHNNNLANAWPKSTCNLLPATIPIPKAGNTRVFRTPARLPGYHASFPTSFPDYVH